MCELADLFGQPCDGCGRSPLAIAGAIGVAHELLEPGQVHNRPIFANRQEAGRRLAVTLADLAGAADVLVLGLPRGGVPVAAEVSQALGVPLDVFVVRKLGVPSQPELALGAIASGGTVVLNDDIVYRVGIDEIRLRTIVDTGRAEVDARDELYRGGRPPLDIDGATVVLVDDGLATGATMRAAVAAVRQRSATSVVIAVPVGAPEAVEMLRAEADRVEAVSTPPDFVAVGLWYRDFRQVSDDEVRRLLG